MPKRGAAATTAKESPSGGRKPPTPRQDPPPKAGRAKRLLELPTLAEQPTIEDGAQPLQSEHTEAQDGTTTKRNRKDVENKRDPGYLLQPHDRGFIADLPRLKLVAEALKLGCVADFNIVGRVTDAMLQNLCKELNGQRAGVKAKQSEFRTRAAAIEFAVVECSALSFERANAQMGLAGGTLQMRDASAVGLEDLAIGWSQPVHI